MNRCPAITRPPAISWILVGLAVAIPWLAGNVAWALWGLGAWVTLQPLYALFVETLRRGDRHANPVASYTLGPSTAETAMVLLHGFADTPEAWRREAESLATHGFRVFVPELSHNADAAVWLATVRATLTEARAHHRKVVLWGHSMGGAAALAASTLHPDALILWAPFLAPRLTWGFVRTLYVAHRALFLWPYTPTWFPAERHGKGPHPTHYRVRRIIPTRTFAAMLEMPGRAVPPACPTLVLLSRRDTVVDNHATRGALPTATILDAANPHSGHALTNAADWFDNLSASLAWLNAHDANAPEGH